MLVWGFLIIGSVIVAVRRCFVVIEVTGKSMEPTLNDGDRLIALRVFKSKNLKVDDIVVFWPTDFIKTKVDVFGISEPPIKRIIGMGNDIIECGENQRFRRRMHTSNLNELRLGDKDLIVPENSIYVLGDNYESSQDSRVWGCIDISHVLAKVIYLLPQSGGKAIKQERRSSYDPPNLTRSMGDKFNFAGLVDVTDLTTPLIHNQDNGILLIYFHPRIAESCLKMKSGLSFISNKIPLADIYLISLGNPDDTLEVLEMLGNVSNFKRILCGKQSNNLEIGIIPYYVRLRGDFTVLAHSNLIENITE